MNTNLYTDPGPGFEERITSAFKSFGVRVLIHVGSLCASIALAVIGEPMGAKATGYILAIFSSYLGCICLLSKGLSRSINGLFPFWLGVLQVGVMVVFGAPIHAALLVGGAQTFLQRAIITKGRMGSGWIVMPFMFIVGIMLLSRYGISFEATPLNLALGSVLFAIIGALGWGIRIFLRHTRMKPLYIQKLEASLARMEVGLGSQQLPVPMQQQLRVLVGEARQYLHALPPFDEHVEQNVLVLEDISRHILVLADRAEPNLWDKATGITHNAILRSSNSIRPWLAYQATQSVDNKILTRTTSVQTQQENADKLLAKKNLLPKDLQPYIETICRSAHNILDTLRDKPQNEHSAVQFLNRYLGASHRVADEIIRITRNEITVKPAQKQLVRSKELLSRLETAFAAEHAHLFQTDVINLTAELGVLDSLLKMDGH